MRHISITAVTEIYIRYTGKAISDKTLIRLKFGSKPFVDNELYKIHCNLSYLGGIPSQYIYMCMQQNSVRPRTARHTLKMLMSMKINIMNSILL